MSTTARVAAAALLMLVVSAVGAFGQSWPTAKPITVVVPYPPGGPTDVIARQLVEHMAQTLGATTVVENVNGAGGTIGSARVARSAPDGYTILIHQLGLAISPALYPKLSFDPTKDLESFGMINQQPLVLVGRKDVPAASWSDFLRWAKDGNRRITIAHPGVGTTGHLCGLLFGSALGLNVDVVSYRGGAAALNDVVAGHVDLNFASMTIGIEQIKAGTVAGIGVTAGEPVASLPKVPALAAAGVVGKPMDVSFWHFGMVPKGVPRDVLDKLNAALRKAVGDPALVAKFEAAGATVFPPAQQSPEFAQQFFASEIERWGDVVRRNNIVAAN